MAEIGRKKRRIALERAVPVEPRAVRSATGSAGRLPTTAALRALLVATTVTTAGAALGCDPGRPDTWLRDAQRHGRKTLQWLGVVEEPTPVVGAIPVVHPMTPAPPASPAGSGSAAPVDADDGAS